MLLNANQSKYQKDKTLECLIRSKKVFFWGEGICYSDITRRAGSSPDFFRLFFKVSQSKPTSSILNAWNAISLSFFLKQRISRKMIDSFTQHPDMIILPMETYALYRKKKTGLVFTLFPQKVCVHQPNNVTLHDVGHRNFTTEKNT